MTNHITRRSILAAAPALVACTPAAASLIPDVGQGGSSKPNTPILRLFHQWEAMSAHIDATSYDWDERALDADVDRLNEISSAMLAQPLTCLQDLCAKITAWSHYGTHEELTPEMFAEIEAVLTGEQEAA